MKRRLGAMRRPEERTSADYYMATMEGVLADGAGHVEHERARLQRLVDDGALGDEKAELMLPAAQRAPRVRGGAGEDPAAAASNRGGRGAGRGNGGDARRAAAPLEELPRAALVDLVLALQEACPEADALAANAADAG